MRFLCISKCRNQLSQYKAHCGHYAKPFGTAMLSFCRVEIPIVLSQEFNKLHFRECFKIKISSCVCTISGNTFMNSWHITLQFTGLPTSLVLFLLGVTVMYLFWPWLWCLAEDMWAISKFSWRVGKPLLPQSHGNVTKLKFVNSNL